MRDPHIRQLLRRTELSKYLNDSHSKVIEEMKIPAANARIDMAVINGHFHGYEIKSACDTLARLPNQLVAYSYIFDYLTVVTENKFHKKILNILPEWVGLSVCTDSKEHEIEVIKAGELNLHKRGFYIAKLLWNEELVQILTELKIPFRKKDRNWLLCETLSQHIDLESLSLIVRDTLKKRTDWKIKEDYAVKSGDDFGLSLPM
jgi:hypothetical protein